MNLTHIKQIIKKCDRLMTHDNIRTITRIINTITITIIMVVALKIYFVAKNELPKIEQAAASLSAEMFDMNQAVTGYVMTGQIGEYVYNQGAQNDKY